MKCQRCGREKLEREFQKGRKTCKHCYKFNQIRIKSEEWLEKISKALKGKKRPEHSARLKGRQKTKEEIENHRKKMLGKKYTLEHRLAISRGHKKAVAEGRCHFKRKEVPSLDNQRERLEYRIWREKVRERDGNKCTQCGVTKRLQVHHLKSYYDFEEGRLDINNGQTLCISCHMKLHNPKGVKKEG